MVFETNKENILFLPKLSVMYGVNMDPKTWETNQQLRVADWTRAMEPADRFHPLWTNEVFRKLKREYVWLKEDKLLVNLFGSRVDSGVRESGGEVGDEREDCVYADERYNISGRHPPRSAEVQ